LLGGLGAIDARDGDIAKRMSSAMAVEINNAAAFQLENGIGIGDEFTVVFDFVSTAIVAEFFSFRFDGNVDGQNDYTRDDQYHQNGVIEKLFHF
jgi:hypothetical protein